MQIQRTKKVSCAQCGWGNRDEHVACGERQSARPSTRQRPVERTAATRPLRFSPPAQPLIF